MTTKYWPSIIGYNHWLPGSRSGAGVGVGMLRGAGDSLTWKYVIFECSIVLLYFTFYFLCFMFMCLFILLSYCVSIFKNDGTWVLDICQKNRSPDLRN